MIKKGIRESKRMFFSKTRDPRKVIEEFRHALCKRLKNNLKGIYIIGSFGLDDFNPNLSDIDFIVTIDSVLSENEFKTVKYTHQEIERKGIQPNLNGIYIPEKDIGKQASEIQTLTWFHEGELCTATGRNNYYEINPITWAELKLQAITFHGKGPAQFNIQINWDEINEYLHKNMNSYWRKWQIKSSTIFHPYYYLTLLTRSSNAWCVSGVARQLYSLNEQKITSKKHACEYFLGKVPEEHTQVLIDTINFRNGLSSRVSWKQKKETLRFMQYCIISFNAGYKKWKVTGSSK